MPGPYSGAHQVLVYSGPGVSPLSLSHTILTLSLILLPHYTVQPDTPEVLASQPWEPACALLVIPGGRDLPYVQEMSVKSRTARRIKEFVELGGKYLGICAGAYFASKEVRFDEGGAMQVVGERELAFYPGVCAGPTYPGFAYAAESGSRAVSLQLEGSSGSSRLDNVYYNGGGYFVDTPFNSDIDILARYSDLPESSKAPKDAIAAVLTRKGKGKAVLCSVHPEYPLSDPPARDAILKLEKQPSQEQIERSEKQRLEWVEQLLRALDLKPPDKQSGDQSSLTGHLEDDPTLLLHPTHPSPIFVFPLPLIPEISSSVLSSQPLRSKLIDGKIGEKVLKDGNDEIHILETSTFGGQVSEGVSQELSKLRRNKPIFPPLVEALTLEPSATTPAPPPPPDFHSLPKTLIMPSLDLPYSPSWTPLFNFESYWKELEAARKRNGKKHGGKRNVAGREAASLGDLVWYAETVTSTQTMIDRNPILLANLPTPLVFMASFQLAGRGRGSNIWLSPPGCLQFSILLTLPSKMASKLVFIQYLMALAVSEAIDPTGKLGVRIKWPNDLYAESEGIANTTQGSGIKGKAKIGGILVNTNLINGEWRVIIGCGVNILNPLPTSSVNQLVSLHNGKYPNKAIEPPTMEGTFAKIMEGFESHWERFIEEGEFGGFLDEYYGRWLHSNQEVTLTTVDPPQKLRIHSITSDYGLLRCKPLSDTAAIGSRGLTPLYNRGDFGGDDRSSFSFSSKGSKEEWVDLQPDGNSFDLMSGLIKRKT